MANVSVKCHITNLASIHNSDLCNHLFGENCLQTNVSFPAVWVIFAENHSDQLFEEITELFLKKENYKFVKMSI